MEAAQKEKLSRLFTRAPPKPATPVAGRRARSSLKVVSQKRAHAFEVLLSKLKLSAVQLASAVLRLDSSVLTSECVEQLLPLLPDADESAKLLRLREQATGALAAPLLHTGPARGSSFEAGAFELAVPEAALAELAAVPRICERLRAWLQLSDFDAHADLVCAEIAALRQASGALLGSEALKHFISLVLRYGNELNAGTARGNAKAISLHALTALGAFKSADNSTSLLRFLADEHEAVFGALVEELAPLAHRVAEAGERRDLAKAVKDAREQLAVVVREIAQHGNGRMRLLPRRSAPAGAPAAARAEGGEEVVALSVGVPSDSGGEEEGEGEEAAPSPSDAFLLVMPPLYKGAAARLGALEADWKELSASVQRLGEYGHGWGLERRADDPFSVAEALEVISALALVRRQALAALEAGRDARHKVERASARASLVALRRASDGATAGAPGADSQPGTPRTPRSLRGLSPRARSPPRSIHGISTDSLHAHIAAMRARAEDASPAADGPAERGAHPQPRTPISLRETPQRRSFSPATPSGLRPRSLPLEGAPPAADQPASLSPPEAAPPATEPGRISVPVVEAAIGFFAAGPVNALQGPEVPMDASQISNGSPSRNCSPFATLAA
ncbi:hypothetical protein T492DRAFT_235098 [Pavlovales sp. CCMP2436]|nr:hypothetical protein T492DRAFT_235098 [Pavlovales sp. CCMP2436]